MCMSYFDCNIFRELNLSTNLKIEDFCSKRSFGSRIPKKRACVCCNISVGSNPLDVNPLLCTWNVCYNILYDLHKYNYQLRTNGKFQANNRNPLCHRCDLQTVRFVANAHSYGIVLYDNQWHSMKKLFLHQIAIGLLTFVLDIVAFNFLRSFCLLHINPL